METMTITPYENESLSRIYDLLFCDKPELFRPEGKGSLQYPFDIIFAAKPDVTELQKVVNDPALESRLKILAFNLLRAEGQPTWRKELLGIIIEVGMDEGLDTLAAYKDGTARYINHSERIVFWDAATDRSQELINNLFAEGLQVVKNIGPWTKPRLGPPKVGEIRLSFLVADGLYFGQGPFEVLAKDAMGGPVIKAATELMIFLTEVKN